MTSPTVAYLLPTGRCNLACAGCYATLELAGRHSRVGELAIEEYRHVIDELVSIGVRTFDISGGEPFLYPDLVPLCEAIRSHPDTRIWLVTNGTSARAGILESLVPLVTRIAFSIDAPDAGLHDSLRGRGGAFDATLQTLRQARRLGFPEIAVNQVLCVANASTTPRMLDLCADEGVDRFALLSFRDVSENGVMPATVPDLGSLQAAWRAVADAMGGRSLPRLADLVVPAFLHPESTEFHRSLARELRSRIQVHHPHLRGLSAFRQTLVVKPHGGITGDTGMVNFEHFEIGSARSGVLTVWSRGAPGWRKRLAAREAALRAREPCGTCPRWHVCRGGCPAAAHHQWGEAWLHDRTCDHFRAAGCF